KAPRRGKAEECYIQIFKLIVEHDVPIHRQYERRLLQYVASARRVGAIDRRYHQEVQGAEATTGSYLCTTTVVLSCEINPLALLVWEPPQLLGLHASALALLKESLIVL
ncbi:MAG: hypothetical protein ACKPKO_58905, partial [Candidatus Fonsibacter sp.]